MTCGFGAADATATKKRTATIYTGRTNKQKTIQIIKLFGESLVIELVDDVRNYTTNKFDVRNVPI